jgi:hypothetical protein
MSVTVTSAVIRGVAACGDAQGALTRQNATFTIDFDD